LVRGEIPNYDGSDREQSGTSIFDPVLTELCYRWFCPPGGVIADPFAGGSVRGIVAGVLGFEYHGFELRAEQVAANREQAEDIAPARMPVWHPGDSAATLPAWNGAADMVFSCPPYGDLEVYSDNPADLSAMPPEGFAAAYKAIIRAAVAALKPDRFACFVVGDYRDKRGFYVNFPGLTVAAFEEAGARYYNEAILVTAVGSLPVRVGKQFAAARKLGKTHQNILVFCKGDPKRATTAISEITP
jgi:DNA modification methylase